MCRLLESRVTASLMSSREEREIYVLLQQIFLTVPQKVLSTTQSVMTRRQAPGKSLIAVQIVGNILMVNV